MNTDLQGNGVDEYVMPGAEALLAGTLALMTGHAQSACARQQGLMAQKIEAQLQCLSMHPGVSPALRAALKQLQGHWARLQCGGAGPWGQASQWHAPAPGLQ